jgi:hypothetical protein
MGTRSGGVNEARAQMGLLGSIALDACGEQDGTSVEMLRAQGCDLDSHRPPRDSVTLADFVWGW